MKLPAICRLLVVISVGAVLVQGCTKNTGAGDTAEDLERSFLRESLKNCIGNTDYDSSVDFFILHSRWFSTTETTTCANGDDDTKATCWEGALDDILPKYHTMHPTIERCIAKYKADAAGDGDNSSTVSHEIWVTETEKQYDGARADCRLREGGDLAGKDIFGFGPEGTKYFSETIKVLAAALNGGLDIEVWIGLNNRVTDSSFTWVDSTPYEPELDINQLAGWALPGQPDNTGSLGNNCVSMYFELYFSPISNSLTHIIQLYDDDCDAVEIPHYGLCMRRIN